MARLKYFNMRREANSLEELVTNSNIAGELRNYTDWHTRLVKFAQLVADWQKEQDNAISRQAEATRIKTQQMCYEKGQADMKQQMFKDAVEGRVFMSFAPRHNQMVMADVDLPTNTKVRIIIVKED